MKKITIVLYAKKTPAGGFLFLSIVQSFISDTNNNCAIVTPRPLFSHCREGACSFRKICKFSLKGTIGDGSFWLLFLFGEFLKAIVRKGYLTSQIGFYKSSPKVIYRIVFAIQKHHLKKHIFQVVLQTVYFNSVEGKSDNATLFL